jgi:DNA-binding IclR family transcriptional regulator
VRATQSVDRLADTLEALADAGRPFGVTELSERLTVHKATASRLLASLERRGLVRRTDGGFLLGPALARLAATAVAELELGDVSRPVLRELVEVTGEAAYLTVPHRGSVLYVEQVTPPGGAVPNDWTGRLGYLHCSSSGKVFAAFGAVEDLDSLLIDPLPAYAARTITDPQEFLRLLPQVRRRGYASSVDESENGLTSVAAPVVGADGHVLAAVGVGTATARCSPRLLAQLGTAAVAASATLTRRLAPQTVIAQPPRSRQGVPNNSSQLLPSGQQLS